MEGENDLNTYFPDVEAMPINTLFDIEGIGPNEECPDRVRQLMQDIDFIVGRDVTSGNELFLYGRELLEKIKDGENSAVDVCVLVISLDQSDESNDLERICALVQIAKGKCDYKSRDQ